MEAVNFVEQKYLKKELPSFKVGDTVNVHVKIVEGDSERIQGFRGVVIAKKGTGLSQTFTVRRVLFGEGVERVFLLHSPRVEKVELERTGRVRRAKLYYLRRAVGKKTRIKERIDRDLLRVEEPVKEAAPALENQESQPEENS